MWAQQTVIVRISPTIIAMEDAEEVARRYADRMYTVRVTPTSFRFRQRPPECFVKGSFRTKRMSEAVSIVYGRLKPSFSKKRSCKPKRGKRRRS